MSKLGEALQRKRRGEGGRAMGFGAAARSKERALLLGVIAASGDEAAAALKAGADFVTVTADDAASAAEQAKSIDGLVGAKLASFAIGELEALTDAGIDFVIADPATTAAAVADHEDLGLVLAANEADDESALRALAPLELDAVLVEAPIDGLSLARRISLSRVAMLAGAPLLVGVTAGASSAELEALREGGAGGVVAPLGSDAAVLAGLIQALEAVPPKSRRHGGRGELAIVPSSGRGDGEDDEHDHEDDD